MLDFLVLVPERTLMLALQCSERVDPIQSLDRGASGGGGDGERAIKGDVGVDERGSRGWLFVFVRRVRREREH